MAIVTQAQNGRRVTLCNISGQTVGACGTIIRPGKSVSVKLAKIQGNKYYMNELYNHVHNDRLHVVVESGSVPAHFVDQINLKYLDAALDAQVAMAQDLWTNPATADTDAYKAALLAPSANTTYSGSDFDGTIGQGSADYARNVTITGVCAAGKALDQKSAIITGYDIEGVLRSETLTVSTGGQVGINTTTYTGAVAFKKLYSVYFPLDSNAGNRGTYQIGFGSVLGLSRPLTQGGIIQEFENNVAPAFAGAWIVSGTSAPNGTYTPVNAPNAARDYLVVYCPN